MAIKSGFFNAFLRNGEYDRKYNADDYSKVFSAFIRDGVRRSGLDDLHVSANGLQLTVGKGFAVCGGRWVEVDADYRLPYITPPAGGYSRLDAVILRVDASEASRSASIVYRTGTPASSPEIPAKDTASGVSELILATVLVAPSAASVTVGDTRPDENLCGWVTTPVGYDEFFASLDSTFYAWFSEKKDTLSSVTLFRQYTWRTVLDSPSSTVVFDIPQYDPTGVDIIDVYVNGFRNTAGVDYTLEGSVITFGTGGGGTGVKTEGSEVVVVCYKSIDGTGLGSVAEKVDELESKINALGDISEYCYFCNGVDDNVRLSDIIKAFNDGSGRFEGVDAEAQLKLTVYGSLGVSAPYSGAGTSANRYVWFNVGGNSGKRVVLDFSNCQHIRIPALGNAYNVIFGGNNLTVNGANVYAVCIEAGAYVDMFSGTSGLYVNGGAFKIITTKTATLAYSGTFNDCESYVSSSDDSAYCFYAKSGHSPIVINGGKHRAYTATQNGYATIVIIASWETSAAVFVNGLNAPKVAVEYFVQRNLFHVSAGTLCANGVCSTLASVNNGGSYTVNGLASVNVP